MKFSCPTCNGRFEAEREHLGTEIQCPHCGEGLALPAGIETEGESTTAASTSARSYWCFISYRHTDNKQEGRQWATWLHQAIETYEIPADLVGTRNELGEEIPSRIFPVFRDEDELPADADLSRPILRALHNSRYLVALCSPGAVSSRFVADEITRFKAMGKSDRIIAAIIAGEPNTTTDAAKQAVGWTAEHECFPEPLRYEVEADGSLSGRPAEPIAADFRLDDCSEGWTSPEAYRERLKDRGLKPTEIRSHVESYATRLNLMKLKVIAGILGVPLGLLTKRDKAHQLMLARRRAAQLRGVVIIFAILTIAALVGGGAALFQRNLANQARLAAEEAQKNEQAINDKRKRLLKEAARSDRLVALELLKQGDSRQALARLARALEYDPESSLPAELAVSILNDWIFPLPVFGLKGTSYQIDGAGATSEIRGAVFSPDGKSILTLERDNAQLIETHTGRVLLTLKGSSEAHFSPDGQRIVTVYQESTYDQTKTKIGDG